ncbi:CPBP family intramembrane metalloprotease [Sphingomonas sp. CGMCC 1.13654]|uniref:CPBP family intramembrane metalloprotease n=1 Tax=Sphingomonas chungangi TaxID=2683589 RepID=A0A838L893_9SPHN|nr:CPBP family intramembrane glutamic endopeptidase [Sphingomonas chungangi]MBA2935130.1 CPBP family intramembrane metalloprotease [Sphingomonas chungangi]
MVWLAIAGLAIAWGLPAIGIGDRLFPGDTISPRIGREAAWWAFAAIILLWVTRVERLPLGSIGLKRPTAGTFGWAFAFFVGMMASVMLSFAVIIPALRLHQDMATTRSLIAVPLWLQCATMVRAGVCEEILYRGYPIERIGWLAGRRWVGALLSLAAFVAAHIGWGLSQFVVVAFGGVLLTMLYLWKRDLPACMIAHALTDLVGFALARAHG